MTIPQGAVVGPQGGVAGVVVGPGEALAWLDDWTQKGFPQPMWLAGEVTQVSGPGPHLYVTLGDDGAGGGGPCQGDGRGGDGRGGVSRIKVTALGLDARRIRSRLASSGVTLQRGMSIRVYGHLRIWPGAGAAELRAVDIDTRVGVGAAERERRRAVNVIVGVGLADRQKAMGVPVAPLRVGVVGPAGHGLEDFRARLDMTAWAWDLRMAVTPSEGPEAGDRLARAVRAAGANADVVVVTRGGGSASLDAYDDPAVIMAIAECPRPVIVAVGHHRDRPLAEMVAWRAEATPTAAAVLLDRVVAAQVADLVSEVNGLLDDAAESLAERAARLESEWHETRLALQRAARPPAAAPAGPALSPVTVRSWRRAALVAAAAVAVLVVIVAILAAAGAL